MMILPSISILSLFSVPSSRIPSASPTNQYVDHRDRIAFGQDEDDTITGSDSTRVSVMDDLNGGDGLDTIFGEDGADHIHGDANGDTIEGGNGADTISGLDGPDTIYGNGGADFIEGG